MMKRITGFMAALLLVIGITATIFAQEDMMKQTNTMTKQNDKMMSKKPMMKKHHRTMSKHRMMSKSHHKRKMMKKPTMK